MMAWLGENFPAGKNYLVGQDHKEQMNSWLLDLLVAPFQAGRKHNRWGGAAERLPQIGRKLGWVPNKIPGNFLTDTVEYEIADAMAAAENCQQPLDQHRETARNWLSQFNLLHLAQQHPLFLSEGETKIIWFLTQWVKKISYLIIGYLPASLSAPKVNELINFMLEEATRHESHPVIILGYEASQLEWCKTLFLRRDWQIVPDLPEYNQAML